MWFLHGRMWCAGIGGKRSVNPKEAPMWGSVVEGGGHWTGAEGPHFPKKGIACEDWLVSCWGDGFPSHPTRAEQLN